MKTLLRGPLLRPALAALVWLAAGCASTVERRIENNPQLFQQLSAQDQQLVREQKLREGMSSGAVFLALGRPDRVSTGRKNGKDFERWTYAGQQAIMTQTFGMGWGGRWGGGWCSPYYDPFFMGGGPMVTYVPYDAAAVDFVNGRAVGWESVGRR